jgi:peptidoglycan/LPS O-acetylase OafA/YrhL
MHIKVSQTKRAFGPDLIRATAIVLVLSSHTFPGGVMFPIIGVARDYLGVWGVEIFFLLSGYLIGGILITDLHEGRLNSVGGVLSFWKRRWFRTLPNYYLFLCLILLLARLDRGYFPLGWKKYCWFGQALFSPHPEFFMAAWSLAIEEWFYLLFPILLLVLSKLILKRERAILAAIAVFLVVPPIVRGFLLPDMYWIRGIRMITLPRLDAITYGVFLAFLKNHHAAIWKLLIKIWPIGAIAAAGLFGHACLHTFFSGHFPSASVVYRVFYFCFISISLALLFPKVASLTSPTGWGATVIRKLSLWSYSIYLSHVFFLGLIRESFSLMGWSLHGGSLALVARDVLVWLTTIPFSAMIYKFYEKPWMDLRDQPLKTIFLRFRRGIERWHRRAFVRN